MPVIEPFCVGCQFENLTPKEQGIFGSLTSSVFELNLLRLRLMWV
jgi:hypothetical protein